MTVRESVLLPSSVVLGSCFLLASSPNFPLLHDALSCEKDLFLATKRLEYPGIRAVSTLGQCLARIAFDRCGPFGQGIAEMHIPP